jgi:serine/threonine-protein phosphatase 2B catalytic subunit
MDAFTWSLPFIGSKSMFTDSFSNLPSYKPVVAEMFLAILSISTEEELLDSEEESDIDEEEKLANLALTDDQILEQKEKIRSKVLAVGRMARAFKMLR